MISLCPACHAKINCTRAVLVTMRPLLLDLWREQHPGGHNMVWIVDGCRGELDAAHFNLGLGERISEAPVAYFFQCYGRGKLFENWKEATKPVLIDFGGPNLWRLVMFDRSSKKGAVGPGGKEYFVQDFLENGPLSHKPKHCGKAKFKCL